MNWYFPVCGRERENLNHKRKLLKLPVKTFSHHDSRLWVMFAKLAIELMGEFRSRRQSTKEDESDAIDGVWWAYHLLSSYPLPLYSTFPFSFWSNIICSRLPSVAILLTQKQRKWKYSFNHLCHLHLAEYHPQDDSSSYFVFPDFYPAFSGRSSPSF